MASILAAQKNTASDPGDNNQQSKSQNSTDAVEHQSRAPRSLFNLFSSEECEDLGLSAYEK
ncbi:MAG: hypothetical protein KAS73_15150, partial [Candidatus Sabulitectum sp.]|nr:hypothetical protein [Candidatus Sabulitectum sp.]